MQKLFDENSKSIFFGDRGNRYPDFIHKISAYIYIRGGLSQYKFFSVNFKLPCIGTVKKFMCEDLKKIHESILRFDELSEFLDHYGYPKEVSISEDGTKILELVEYDAKSNRLTGLVAPIDYSTGMGKSGFFIANSARNIFNSITNFQKGGYLQVIIAKPNYPQALSFLLGFHVTDNHFTNTDVSTRTKLYYTELTKRGINLICTGSDGDSRFIMSQKQLAEFGNFTYLENFCLAGNINSSFMGFQDPMHIAKKIKNLLFDPAGCLRLGNYRATRDHLVILIRLYDKKDHGLTKTDIDPNDLMNYSCIPKITKNGVITLLKEINAEGTLAVLQLIDHIWKAFILETTPRDQRLYHAIFAAQFIRLWRQWINDEEMSIKSCVTPNVCDGVELNVLFLAKMILESNVSNIHSMSSQNCESFFRLLRSYTPMQSTVTNFSVKSFISRVHKIEYERKIMHELKDQIIFPNFSHQAQVSSNIESLLTNEEIRSIISRAVDDANQKMAFLGIENNRISLGNFIKNRQEHFTESNNEENDEPCFSSNTDSAANDSDEDQEPIDEILEIQNVKFLEEFTTDSYVTVVGESGPIKLKKNQMIWMIQNDKIKISSDKNRRFMLAKSRVIPPVENVESFLWKSDKITKGDIIIITEDTTLYCGNVLSFRYSGQKTKKRSIFNSDFVDLKLHNLENLCLLLDPAHELDYQKFEKITNNNIFINVASYICHINSNIDLNDENLRNIVLECIKNKEF